MTAIMRLIAAAAAPWSVEFRIALAAGCGLALGLLLGSSAVAAPPSNPAPTPQARTYLAPTGNDSGGCTAAAPCRTLQAALNMTLAGGEVFVLASGYYGGATIGAAVTITAEGAALGAAGITIAAGAADDVHLRGLDLDGARTAAFGVQFTSGRSLTITKSTVRNFTNTGISASAGAVFIAETGVTGNGNNGIALSGAAVAVISRATVTLNATGIFSAGAPLTVTDSLVSGNGFGIATLNANAFVRNTIAINSLTAGLRADRGTISLTGSRIDTPLAVNGGAIVSFGTNYFTNGGPTSSVPLSYLLDDKGGRLLDGNGQPLIAG